MKVKKIKNLCWAWMCMMLFVLIACDDDGEKNIIFSNAKEKEQTIAASKTEGEVTFVAVADWQASVVSGADTRAAAPNWITINPDHGPAGNQTIKITLLLNNTGADRSATIKLVCGEETVSISITQEKKKEGEVIPEPTAKWLVDVIEYHEYFKDSESETSIMVFTYDDNKRVVSLEENFGYGDMNISTYTYADREIKESIRYKEAYNGGIYEFDGKINYMLDNQGKVVSWVSEFPGDAGDGKNDIERGTLEYSADDYLTRFVKTYEYDSSSQISKLDWANNNLISIDNDTDVSTMKYGTQLNNSEINLDLNWAFLATEWADNAVFDGEQRFRLFANLGKRSQCYITEEQGHTKYDRGYYSRSYEFDSLNRPSKITVTHVTEEEGERLTMVAMIRYK